MENKRPDWVQELFDDENNFWRNEYPKKSEDERVKFWAADLYRSMRDQEESDLKIYSMYTKEWLAGVLEKEPEFVKMLPKIYNIWGGMFDSATVDNIIKKILRS